MEQYNVTGMSCAACSARVEKAVKAVSGVTECSVSLLTNSMGVEGSAASEDIVRAVIAAGYGASLKSAKKSAGNTTIAAPDYENELKDTETPKIRKRLIASVIFLLPLMYVSMGNMMWGWPVPAFLDGNHLSVGIYELVLAAIIMVINQKFFISGFKGLLHKSPNMDTLVAMGSSASFIYSLYALFAMSASMNAGDMQTAMSYMDEFYFESAAMILTLITVGKMLEARSKGKTTDALKSLMRLAPKTAILIKDGKEIETPIEGVRVGDHFAVKPGENIPVDGFVVSGASAVNEAALTGESIPVDKKTGDIVSAATLNQSGYIVCEATRVGEDTTLSQIIQMVSDAASTKAPIAKIADKVSGIFVPTVLGIALLTFIIWMLTGQTVGFSLARAISVLVISCPCALGLATPVAIMVGNGMGARHGIMFKTAASLEEAGKTTIVALDKTGTITSGEPKVTEIIPADGITENELLTKALALEVLSEHPLAKAIVARANELNLEKKTLVEFEILAGNGLKGTLEGSRLVGGNYDYVSTVINNSLQSSANTATSSKVRMTNENAATNASSGTGISTDKSVFQTLSDIKTKADALAEKGHTPLYFAEDGRLLGVIAVADTIKEDSAKAISRLKAMGIHVVMLTGDNERTAKAIGQTAGVDEVVANVRPEGKEEVIRTLQKYGKVTMVGDGINDAPALTRADMGIAIGAGTDIAIDAADIVLMKSSLLDAVAAIRLSQATLTNIKENLFWAFIYNIIGIPLAAGLWIPIFGWTLNPMFGAAAMSLSSFSVVTNALRLNLFKLYSDKSHKKVKNSIGHEPILNSFITKDNSIMVTEYKVKGMMCGHCEAHVKKAVEKIEGVLEATADHNTGIVTVKSDRKLAEADITAAVVDAGYEMA